MKQRDNITIKIFVDDRRILRRIAAHSGETMMQVIHRLLVAEWQRIMKQEKTT